jgi:N-acetylglucosamine-6-phosphate deacetylase
MLSLPGFVDLQVNGYAGIDFLEPSTTVADLLRAADLLRQRSTAGFLLTVCTHRREAIEINVAHAREAMDRQGPDGNILGIHLEGPFISPEYGYRGAHLPQYIIPPDLAWFLRLQEIARGAIRMVTIAPELPGAIEFIRAVSGQTLVSLGHANPDYATLRQAIAAGLRAVTHFGNGCRPEINRHDNILVRILACPELSLCFIPDGQHLPEPFLRMLLNSLPARRLVATSDMVMYAGMPPGVYEREGCRIRLREDGRLCPADDEKLLYGSSSTLLQCMNHLAGLRHLAPSDLVDLAVTNPLRLLGLDPAPFLRRPPALAWDEAANRFATVNPGV